MLSLAGGICPSELVYAQLDFGHLSSVERVDTHQPKRIIIVIPTWLTRLNWKWNEESIVLCDRDQIDRVQCQIPLFTHWIYPRELNLGCKLSSCWSSTISCRIVLNLKSSSRQSCDHLDCAEAARVAVCHWRSKNWISILREKAAKRRIPNKNLSTVFECSHESYIFFFAIWNIL